MNDKIQGMAELSRSEEMQKARYSRVHAKVEKHNTDAYSLRYRAQFIDGPLGAGIDFRGKKVLEAMCGGGYTTDYLLSRGAEVTGLDISPELIGHFRGKWPGCSAVVASVLDTGFPDASFDAVVIMGGLHHVHPHVQGTVDEIHRILKPGGHFCFVEPHAGSFPDMARKLWYRLDRWFERNEAAVDVTGLAARNADRFEIIGTDFYGNLAYLLVFNSLVFRIPHAVKKLYSPGLLAWEGLLGNRLGKVFTCYAVSRWRKRPTG